MMTLPMVTLPVPKTYKKFGDYMICQSCNMAIEWCGCDKQPAASATTAQDGAAAKSLDIRIRDAKGAAMQIGLSDPWVVFCGYCGRTLVQCCTDPRGCGTADDCQGGK